MEQKKKKKKKKKKMEQKKNKKKKMEQKKKKMEKKKKKKMEKKKKKKKKNKMEQKKKKMKKKKKKKKMEQKKKKKTKTEDEKFIIYPVNCPLPHNPVSDRISIRIRDTFRLVFNSIEFMRGRSGLPLCTEPYKNLLYSFQYGEWIIRQLPCDVMLTLEGMFIEVKPPPALPQN